MTLVIITGLWLNNMTIVRSRNLQKGNAMNDKYESETKFLKLIVQLMHDVRLTSGGRLIDYSEAFKNNRMFTEFVSRVIDEAAEKMELLHYREYYTIDHVLYRDEDKIPETDLPFHSSRVHGTWLKRFRVIVEHENSLDAGGGYQEFSKLMLFNSGMKVLMGYGEAGADYDAYAKDYQYLYKDAPGASTEKPILFIGEYKDRPMDAYLIMPRLLLKYHWEKDTWMQCEDNS